jgi:hypothetical protein
MIFGMRGRNRAPRFASALVLPLALWSVVPGIRWCSLGWEEIRPECFTSCAVAEVVTAPCPAAASSCPAAADVAPEACGGDPECCDAPPEYPGGRAFCLGGPSGGNGVSSVSPVPGAPGPAAIVPRASAIAVTHVPERRVASTTVVHPPPTPAGAVPHARAPPEPGSITG